MSDWEHFAKDDAEFYILTSIEADREPGESSEETFFRTGRETVSTILERVDKHVNSVGTAAELGCGIGRLSYPMAERFGEVRGVDISTTMLARLNETAAERGISNINTYLPAEAWDEYESLDFVYSHIVFQHISDATVIEDYVRKSVAALKDGGMAYYQFDSRPATLLYRFRNLLPDIILPRTQRRGIRRIRRQAEWITNLVVSSGFQIVHEYDQRSASHALVLKK